MLEDYVFTSESVTEGHPDKMADQISDAIVDAFLSSDPLSRVACEVMVAGEFVVVAGEVTSKATVDLQGVVREKIKSIGYDSAEVGFDGNSCEILTAINAQSSEIAQGVNEGEGAFQEQGAGDQGLMFGHAVNETPEMMPLSIDLAHKLAKRLATVRKDGTIPLLRPDGKTQVSVEYENAQVKRIHSLVISAQHHEDLSQEALKEQLMEEVIQKVIPKGLVDTATEIYINPTGRFVLGGPQSDCGLTGRKIIIDTYGGHGAHGGGAFSGKDPSKVDRSAAYAARSVAKHIVAAGLAEKALIQVSYAIGVARPISFLVETFGTHKVDLNKLGQAVRGTFDMRPKSIIQDLDLLRPIYEETACYGHFGRVSPNGLTWEKLSKLERLQSYF